MDETTLGLLLAPLVLLELGMKLIALLNLRKQEQTNGPKWMWVLVILLVSLFGWMAYFLVGRKRE
jgi:hypothetical protein